MKFLLVLSALILVAAASKWRFPATKMRGLRPEGRIIGGEIAKDTQFPYIAILVVKNYEGKSWQCGSSIISDGWVLTAAHCVDG